MVSLNRRGRLTSVSDISLVGAFYSGLAFGASDILTFTLSIMIQYLAANDDTPPPSEEENPAPPQAD
jgi:hypothetical protein